MHQNVGMSDCCLSGKVHQGQPAGREDEIGGLATYISEPENHSKAKSIIFITDSQFPLLSVSPSVHVCLAMLIHTTNLQSSDTDSPTSASLPTNMPKRASTHTCPTSIKATPCHCPFCKTSSLLLRSKKHSAWSTRPRMPPLCLPL